jgi:hypothetical protein
MEALGIRLRGLGQDDREAPLASMARDVGCAHSCADPLAGGDEVGPSPLLQVEDEEPEASVVAPGPGDLPAQALFEIARVVEAREVIGVREPARLREEACVLERRAEDPGELLELLQLGVGERPLGTAPEDRQGADPLLTLAEERNGQPAAQTELVVGRLLGRVEVAQAHRSGPASVRRQADELARGLLLGKREAGGDGVALLLAKDDHGRVGARELAHGFEGSP